MALQLFVIDRLVLNCYCEAVEACSDVWTNAIRQTFRSIVPTCPPKHDSLLEYCPIGGI